MKKILSQIRTQYKDRRNIDIERFMELRESSDERRNHSDEEGHVPKVEISQEQMAFGIEVLSNGTKQFKNYDKVLLSESNPFKIACLDPERRTSNDNLYLAHYLQQNVKFFAIMNLTLIAFISRKLTAKKYEIDEKIIIKGEVGDCMYIVYKGLVEVVREGVQGNPILIESGSIFGETALQNNVTRTATIIARSDVECMILSKKDYLNVVFESKNLERSNNLLFLLSLKFFKNWIGYKVEDINKNFGILELKPQQVVYKAGNVANVFYIVRAGTLHMESVIEIEDAVRYPIARNQWEYRKVIRKISYRVKELKRGDMFGHDEIFDECKRKATITSIDESELMYINLEEFLTFFNNDYAREKLSLYFPKIDQRIRESILNDDIIRK